MTKKPAANLVQMDDYAARFAEFLETIAARVRAMTVDRVEKGIRYTAVGIVVATLALMGVVFLFITLYRALEIPLGPAGAFAVMTGLFIVGGVLLWWRRDKFPDDTVGDSE